jgi:hypothetical protein
MTSIKQQKWILYVFPILLNKLDSTWDRDGRIRSVIKPLSADHSRFHIHMPSSVKTQRGPLTLGPQVEAFLQKCPVASARIIAKHFLTTSSTVKEILQRELAMRKFSRRRVYHSLSGAQKITRVDAAKEMFMILQESEMNDFDSIARGDESWFQHTTASLKTFARSAADVIPRTRQAAGTKTYDHGVLHHKETYRVRCSSKRQHSQSAIFHQ